ncbi:hypothetical protein AVEN_152935-1 [Araneus ventricosus]|uniref:Uncharacterized protein n=1 Tax=Araneus ventricosus TaxID=182803 RepID=A0A4Y2AER8_ARAVE|nr:hypothetical protein AVEN_152935-1 [Araneus ventricosus]
MFFDDDLIRYNGDEGYERINFVVWHRHPISGIGYKPKLFSLTLREPCSRYLEPRQDRSGCSGNEAPVAHLNFLA